MNTYEPGCAGLKSHCADEGVHGEPAAEDMPKGKPDSMMAPHNEGGDPNKQKSTSDMAMSKGK